MPRLMTTALVSACLLAPAAFAQSTETPAPAPVVIPVQTQTEATPPAEPRIQPAARKSDCDRARQITS